MTDQIQTIVQHIAHRGISAGYFERVEVLLVFADLRIEILN